MGLPPPVSCKPSPDCPSLALPWSSPAPLGNISFDVSYTVSPLWSGNWVRPLPAVRVRPLRRFLSLEPALTNRNRRGNAGSAIDGTELGLLLTAAASVLLLVHSIPGLSVSVDEFSIHIRRESHDKGVAKPPHFRPCARHVEHCGRRRSHWSPDNAQVWQSV